MYHGWVPRYGRFVKVVVRIGPATAVFIATALIAWVGIRRYAVTYKVHNFDNRAWTVKKVHHDNSEVEKNAKLEGVTLPARLNASTYQYTLKGSS